MKERDMAKSKKRDPIPDHFKSIEEAAEFWDTHDLQRFAYECSGSDTRQPLVEPAKIRPPRQRRLILAVGFNPRMRVG
jgi:hypothetical protein